MKNYKMNFEYKLLIMVFVLFYNCINAFAQNGILIDDLDILEKQTTVMKEYYPQIFAEVEIKDVQKINSRQSKVLFEKDNQQYEAVVNSSREELLLVATSRVVNEKELPKIVMDAFNNSKYKSWNVEKTFEVKTPYSGQFYRIDVSQKNEKTQKKEIESLFYTDLGQFKNPPY